MNFAIAKTRKLCVPYLVPTELELIEGHVRLLQISEESRFLWPKNQECVSNTALASRRPAHPVYVLLGVVRGVELHNPIHIGNVKAPGGHVSAEEDSRILVAILEERLRPFCLLLFPLKRLLGVRLCCLHPNKGLKEMSITRKRIVVVRGRVEFLPAFV